MKKFRAVTTTPGLASSVLKMTLSFVAICGLATAFWMASSPLAYAARVTPAEMLQSNLPGKMTLATASKADVLTAVCKSITKSRNDAADIVRTAAGARKEISDEIVAHAVRCSHDEKGPDCELARRILHAGTEADPDHAAKITETVISLVPDCGLDSPAEGPGSFGAVVTNINPPPGGGGGGGITNTCQVCHNGNEVTVACDSLQEYLRGHPGDTSGPCGITPITNP